MATEGLPGCEHVLDGCELNDVTAIADNKFSGLAVAVTVGFFTVREFHKLWPTACSSGSRPTGWLPSPNSTI